MTNSEGFSSASNLSVSNRTGIHDIGGLGSLAGLQAGHVLGGRFTILKQIGMGGMGAVYQAHDLNRGDDLAIKVMLPELVSSDDARQRFINEAKIAIKLAHQNIVNTYDVLTEGAYLFITMELLEGRSLRQDIETRKRGNRPYTEAEALEITHALCDALEYAHDYTVHRDIKPENIWLTTKNRVKLMDFGIARMLNGSQMSQSTSVLGTAYYMAPEQLTGSQMVDRRADQYALGVMLYELLTGQVPTGRSKSVRQQRQDVSAAVSDAIDCALSPNPQDRYPDIRTFASALKGAKQRAGQTSLANPANRAVLASFSDWIGQHRMIVGISVALWGGVLISSFLVYQNTQKQNQINWEKWQTKMAGVFKKTEELTGDPNIRIQAWEKYLVSYAKDNPFSAEDEDLRMKAEAHLQEVEAEKKESIRMAKQQNDAVQRQRQQAQAAQQVQVAQLQRQQAENAANASKANSEIGFAILKHVLR